MILDERGRYALTQLNPTTLWHYDKRWRGVKFIEPFDGKPFRTLEGTTHMALVSQPEPGGEITVSVRSAAEPQVALATGTFGDTWAFESSQPATAGAAWAKVPEYLLTTKKDGSSGLLRIADDAEVDPLEGFKATTTVTSVPDSRLVVIAGAGSFTVYDPIPSRAIRHFDLAGGNENPLLRFRNADELWLNDIDTMLKIETKQFEVIDAAGSEAVDSEEVLPKELGQFGRWTFAAGNELCVVTRPAMGDVLVLDVMTMLPVARGVFGSWQPIDAVLAGRNIAIAVDLKGKVLRARLRRVSIKFVNE